MKFKKFAAIVLSLAVIFAMSIPAFAADSSVIEVNAENIVDVINGATEDISVKLTEDIQSNHDEDIYYGFSIADGVTVTIDTNGYKFYEIEFTGGSLVINGDVGYLSLDSISAVINGNITGVDGNKEVCDMTDPEGFDDGDGALFVNGGYGMIMSNEETEGITTTVIVNGNVTGGKSYGTYGYGGYGIGVGGNNVEITVNGNVTGGDVEADPNIESIEGSESMGGNAISVYQGDAIITVNGNVKGGSTNGHNGIGGAAIELANADNANVTVNGTAASGSGANGYGAPIQYFTFIPTPLDLGEFVVPTVEDFETELEADSYYSGQAFNDIQAVCEANEVDSSKRRDFYSNYMLDVISEIFGEDFFNNLNSQEEYEAAFNALTQQQRDKYFEECYNCLTYVLTGEGDLQREYATITASKIIDTNGTGIVVFTYNNGNDDVENTEIAALIESAIDYTVKVIEGQNGKVEAVTTAKMGETVDITVTANDGYKTSKVYVNGKEIKAVDGKYSYVMADNTGIEISAEFEKLPAQEKPAAPTTPDNTDNGTKSPATGDSTVLPIIAILSLGAIVVAKKKIEA